MKEEMVTVNKGKKIKLFTEWKSVLFTVMWVSILFQNFFWDGGTYLLVKIFPDSNWVFVYKPILILTILLLTSKMKLKKFLTELAAFVLFPLLVIACFLVYLFQKYSWNGVIAFASAGVALFSNFRKKLIVFIVYALSVYGIRIAASKMIIGASLASLFFCFLLCFFAVVNLAVRKQNLSEAFIERMKNYINKNGDKAKVLIVDDADIKIISIQKKVEENVLMNRVMLFTAKKIQIYKETKIFILQEMALFLLGGMMFALTFSLLNFGIYRMDDMHYLAANATLLDFIIYTTNVANTEIMAISALSKLIVIVYHGISVAFFGFLITLVIKNIKSNQMKELDLVIEGLEAGAKVAEERLCENTPYANIEEVVLKLAEVKSSTIKYIDWMTRNMDL